MWLLTGITGSFLVVFPALFSIVNPIGGALIYSQITQGRGHERQARLAWRIATYSLAVMLVALLAGAPVMSFFGVSLEALRVAGGAVVAASAWAMLNAPHQNETKKQEQAAPASREDDAEIAFFPLTMPFTTGPGTISVAIALSAATSRASVEAVPQIIGAAGAAAAVALLVGFCYASADRVVALLGAERARVLTRLSAFLLLCIGAQIMITGLQGVLASALSGGRAA